MELALPPWPEKPALFLDLDGTLVEIAEHPDKTSASPRLRALLPALPTVTDGAVALISGRRIEELDRILAPHAYIAAGVHGLQRRDLRGQLRSSQDIGSSWPIIRELLEGFVSRHAGLWVEDKAMALAVHYRSRPELEPDVHRFVAELQRELPPDVEILLGNRVFEIKPGVMDKGNAIDAFMEEAPFVGRTPVFVGDDVTDEAGFRAVNAAGGVSVKVGAAATIAEWRLADVDAVLAWLERAVAARTSPRS
jgi:trehalose 6-phosphate phosphatase